MTSGNGQHPPPKAPNELKRAEYAYTRYYVDIDEHIRLTGEPCDFEDLLKPTFWSRNIDRLKPRDVLRVVKEGEFDCELVVTWTGPGGCGVKLRGAIIGTKFCQQMKAIEAEVRAEEAAERAASVAPSQEGGTAP